MRARVTPRILGLQAPRRTLISRLLQERNRTFSEEEIAEQKGYETRVLSEDDLFHKLSESPFAEMAAKGERIRKLAYCPVSWEKYGERIHVAYECPKCGYPTHADEQRYREDTEHHKYWPRIREANEDEHDLRNGTAQERLFLPGLQADETQISFASWDMFLYSRGFAAQDDDRMLRHVSKMLTFPITIGSVLHKYSPYTLRNRRLLPEGLRSLAALRQELHVPPYKPSAAQAQKPPSTIRIILLGARAETLLPISYYLQLTALFPLASIHVINIGPEAHLVRTPATIDAHDLYGFPAVSTRTGLGFKMTTIRANYEDVHDILSPFDPFLDVYFAFAPGFGFPSEADPATMQLDANWLHAVQQILQTKCAVFCTGFSPADVERDVLALERSDNIEGEFDWLMPPGENIFGSMRWEIAEFDPRVAVKFNWGLWGFRGKLYELRD